MVRILKVNQELLKRFVYYSGFIDKLMEVGRMRLVNVGFRALGSNLVRDQSYKLKVTKLS